MRSSTRRASATSSAWREVPPSAVERRYDRLAPVYRLFDLLWLPRGLRRRAVEALSLADGMSVLELGCGTGLNLPLLGAAVGPDGNVIGIDRSEQMLARAVRRTRTAPRAHYRLIRGDAAIIETPPVDAVLCSLCYATMSHRAEVLAAAWERLKPGGRLVIFDCAVPGGPLARLIRAAMFVVSRASVLGNPDVRPSDDLAAYDPDVHTARYWLGFYIIARAVKRARSEAVIG